jgi:hypothetical protein
MPQAAGSDFVAQCGNEVFSEVRLSLNPFHAYFIHSIFPFLIT